MNVNNHPFCNQINDGGRLIDAPRMEDLRQALDLTRASRQLDVLLTCNRDMDSSMEFISTSRGIAILGGEDSLRGCFSFYFCDTTKPKQVVTVGIHEVPQFAFCDSLDAAAKIAESFFQYGELDQRFSWIVDVQVESSVKRGNLLKAGANLPLKDFIERVARLHAT